MNTSVHTDIFLHQCMELRFTHSQSVVFDYAVTAFKNQSVHLEKNQDPMLNSQG